MNFIDTKEKRELENRNQIKREVELSNTDNIAELEKNIFGFNRYKNEEPMRIGIDVYASIIQGWFSASKLC